jgi:uncharacterized protein (DUF302 family)
VYHILESDKPFEEVVAALAAAVVRHGFGLLHTHDLGETLRSKGFAFEAQCRVLEVCNPGYASKVLAQDMRLNMALPCRISVWTVDGRTQVGMIEPVPLLGMLSQEPALQEIAEAVEQKLRLMMADAV